MRVIIDRDLNRQALLIACTPHPAVLRKLYRETPPEHQAPPVDESGINEACTLSRPVGCVGKQ